MKKLLFGFLFLSALTIKAQEGVKKAPVIKEGDGPYPQLIIRGVMLIDGTGAPPVAPGGAVALADVWGIQTTSAPLIEARWSSGGALCLDHVRDPNTDAAAVRDLCGIPTCSAGGLGSAGELALSSLTP